MSYKLVEPIHPHDLEVAKNAFLGSAFHERIHNIFVTALEDARTAMENAADVDTMRKNQALCSAIRFTLKTLHQFNSPNQNKKFNRE